MPADHVIYNPLVVDKSKSQGEIQMKVSKWLMVPVAAAALFVSAQASADLALAKKSGCLACHSVDKKIVGPAWKDVAAKYKGDASAKETLIGKVSKGGKGNWTAVTGGAPMPPYSPRVSDADIATLVDFVMGL